MSEMREAQEMTTDEMAGRFGMDIAELAGYYNEMATVLYALADKYDLAPTAILELMKAERRLLEKGAIDD